MNAEIITKNKNKQPNKQPKIQKTHKIKVGELFPFAAGYFLRLNNVSYFLYYF